MIRRRPARQGGHCGSLSLVSTEAAGIGVWMHNRRRQISPRASCRPGIMLRSSSLRSPYQVRNLPMIWP